MTTADWHALIIALVVLANALSGYLIYLSHRNGNGKPQ